MKGRSGGVLVGEWVEWQSEKRLIESFAPAWARWLSGLGRGQRGQRVQSLCHVMFLSLPLKGCCWDSLNATLETPIPHTSREQPTCDLGYQKIQKEEKYRKENFSYFKVVVLRSWAKGHELYCLCGWRSFVNRKSWARHANAFPSNTPITPLFKTMLAISVIKFGHSLLKSRCTNVSSFNDALESPRGNKWQIYLLHETATDIIM